jgi:hypothetical protein
MDSMPRDGAAAAEETESRDAGQVPPTASHGLADSLSPVDLPDPPVPLPHGLKWTSLVIAWASLVLALFNAHAIRGWSYQLPPGAASAQVVNAAESWFDTVDQAGLNRPVEAMHAWWQGAREARFHEEEVEQGKASPVDSPTLGAPQNSSSAIGRVVPTD